MEPINATVGLRLLAKASRLFTGTLDERIIEIRQNARRAGASKATITNTHGMVTVSDSNFPQNDTEPDSAVADPAGTAAPSDTPTRPDSTLAAETTVTPPSLSAAASVAVPTVRPRGRHRVEHTWPGIGTVLEGRLADQTYGALVIAAPKLKSGRAVQVITGPATGQVFRTMTAAMLGATAKQRRKLGPGQPRKNLPASGWAFWRAATTQRASA